MLIYLMMNHLVGVRTKKKLKKRFPRKKRKITRKIKSKDAKKVVVAARIIRSKRHQRLLQPLLQQLLFVKKSRQHRL